MLRSSLLVASLLVIPAAASADIADGPIVRHPPSVVGVGIVVTFTIGREPALGVGLEGSYLSLDTEIGSELRKDAWGRGAYGRAELTIPFDATRNHMRYSLGLLTLRGATYSYDETPRGGGKSVGYFTGARFGLFYRESAGEVRQSWGPEIEPSIGSGAYLVGYLGARLGAPLGDLLFPGAKSHGADYGITLGSALLIPVSGTTPGTVY
jgi:hypothetical protein